MYSEFRISFGEVVIEYTIFRIPSVRHKWRMLYDLAYISKRFVANSKNYLMNLSCFRK